MTPHVNARFIAAYSQADQLPASDRPEIAIVGRSNCGKSSLINTFTQQKSLARTSSTPGRTRELVFFEVEIAGLPPFHLVDLPGYGYAKVAKTERAAWDRLISNYIEQRSQLEAMLLLMDIRRDPTEDESGLLQWCTERDLDRLVVLTKADKLAKNKRFGAQERTKRRLHLMRRPAAVSTQDPGSLAPLHKYLERVLKGPGTTLPG